MKRIRSLCLAALLMSCFAGLAEAHPVVASRVSTGPVASARLGAEPCSAAHGPRARLSRRAARRRAMRLEARHRRLHRRLDRFESDARCR